MQEQIQSKVLRSERHVECMKVMESGLKPNGKTYVMNPLLNYIATLMEQAYIAGHNQCDLTKPLPPDKMVDTGEIVAKAKNYTKDKGFRI